MRLLFAVVMVLVWATQSFAAAPTIVSTTCTEVTTVAATDHLVPKPASLANGDLWVACLGIDGQRTTDWSATGLTEITDLNSSTSVSQSCAYRFADGTEAATVTAVTSATAVTQQCSWRITGHHTTSPPEAGTTATGNDANPDAPTVTAPWGNLDSAFLTVTSVAASATFSVDPTGYTNCTQPTSAISMDMRACSLTTTADGTDDPSTWTQDLSQRWIADTIVVRPTVATAGSVVGGEPLKTLIGGGVAR